MLAKKGEISSTEDYRYEGEWIDGMKHGKGKFVFSDKKVYEGDFVENRKEGFGM
jgi:hypothetical protein